LIIRAIALSIDFSHDFQSMLGCFFDRWQHRFSIVPFIVLGARKATSDLMKPLRNAGHAQKNRCPAGDAHSSRNDGLEQK